MNVRKVAAVSVTVAAAATLATAAAVAASASAAARSDAQPASVTVAAGPRAAGAAGWQGQQVYNPAVGTPWLWYHYACPAGMIARSGGYWVLDKALAPDYVVGGNAPLWANDNEWQWYFVWPAGAPAGFTMIFDVDCTAGPA